jgi:uncharacterized membrane protein
MAMAGQMTAAPMRRDVFWALVTAILVVALAFRLPGIATRSLWIDELYSEWFAARSLSELWTEVPRYETHPPLYYTLLKLWSMVFGNSELGLRSLSLVASLLTVLSVAVAGRHLGRGRVWERAGLVAAALLAVNFAGIRDAQNVRPYALQTLLSTLAVIAALVLVARLSAPRNGADDPMRRVDGFGPAILLGLSAGFLLWLHNTSLFISFGIWLGLALSLLATPAALRLRNLVVFVGAGCLALLVWAPAVPMFLRQLDAFSGLAFWLTPKARDLYSAWLLMLGDGSPALLLALALLAFGLLRIAGTSRAIAITAVTILVVPLYAVLALSFSVKPVYIQRLFAWMVPLGLFVMAYGIVSVTRHRWLAALAGIAALSLATAKTMDDASRPIDDWKAIVAEIATHARPGDVVITVPAEGSIAVGYYARRHQDFPPVVCIPGCYPQRGLKRTYISNFGAPKLIEADGAMVEQALARHRRVWLVQVSISLYDPGGIVRKRIGRERTFVRYFGNSLAKVELFE